MNKLITKLAVLAMGAASVMGVSSSDIGSIKASAEIQSLSTFEILTSVADIDPTATYIFGADDPIDKRFEGMAYHYDADGTSWGLVRSVDLGVYEYTLTAVDASARTFTASFVDSGGTTRYLAVTTANSNNFITNTSAFTLALGREEGQSMVYNSGLTRSFQYNPNATQTSYGLRAYKDSTGTPISNASYAAFYKVVPPSGGGVTTEGLGDAYINRLKPLVDKGNTLSLAKTDEAEVNNIIAQFNGTAVTGNLEEAVKNYVINKGYNAETMTTLKTNYDRSIAKDFSDRVMAIDVNNVTTADEKAIEGFNTEFLELTKEQQRAVDEEFGAEAYLYQLNEKLDEAFVNPVVDLIEKLPAASAIQTAADWSLYDTAVTEAKNAYDALGTRQSLVSQTLVTKLNDVIAAMELVKPALTEALYEFSATANTAAGVVYPTGWRGTLEGYYGSLASYKAKGEYTQMDSLLPVNVKSITNLMITVYAATNSATKASTLTVSGLNNGEIIDGCSEAIIPEYKSVNTAANATTAANENPKIVSLNSDTLINGIRVECTTKGGNVALIGINVSYVVAGTYSDEYVSLVNDITELNTCTAYVNAAEYRARYNALAADEKADFDAKLIKDNDTSGAEVSVTCGAKLAYLEYLVENPPKEVSTGSSIINNAKEQTPITLIVLVAVLGLSAVTAYYFINKKKLQA